VAADDQISETKPIEPPRGMYDGRLDDKGRLKLPAQYQHFINSLTEKKLFVTSLDRRIVQIYPITVWRENEKFFESFRENPQVAQDVAFNANDLGADAEMDSQGRVLFNTTLREQLDLENQQLHLYAYRGHVKVLTHAIYEERRQRASRAATENVDLLERAGLK
jgi:DNA-binding transcriptional regulator/RsmH inhibitor MraZ